MKKSFMGLILMLLMVVVLAACSNNKEESDAGRLDALIEKGEIVVGFANEKPYAYQEDGELKGVAVDVATKILNDLGIENVKGVLAEFDNLIPGLNAKKYDIVTASMAIKPDRCENVAFGEPEVTYGEGLIVKAGNPLNLYSYEDIAANPDATVAIMSGTTAIDFTKEKGVQDSQVQQVGDIAATFSAVSSGRADATTGTEQTVRMALESANDDGLEFVEEFIQPNVEGNPSYGAAAFRIDDNELREAYNKKLAELKETETYGELLDANYFSEIANGVDSSITTEMVCSGEVYED